MMNDSLILASKSPRRIEMLTQLGYSFTSKAADIDESQLDGENADDYVLRVAKNKAIKVSEQLQCKDDSIVILASDTCVVIGQTLLGKPKNKSDFLAMMRALSGNKHQVLTAIVAIKGNNLAGEVVASDVYFKPLTEQEILDYWQTKEPLDKAGGYGIQGYAARFVSKISGSYSSIVGLPLVETQALLASFSIFPEITELT